MKQPNLSTIVGGIHFENPFILVSAPSTNSEETIRRTFDAGWAGAVIKSVRPDSVPNSNVSPRFTVLKSQDQVIGFENMELFSEKPVSAWVESIKNLKRDYPTKAVIASIMGADQDSWQALAIAMCEAGADGLELNFSCPNGVIQQKLGMTIGQDTELIQKITAWVKAVATAPVLVKLSPNVTDIAAAAKAAVAGGADGISAINTVSCLMGVDVETLCPLPAVDGQSTYGGYSGIAVKPIGLRCIAQICKAVEIPVHGIGGISTWEDAVQYIALGAGVVQVCTAVMLDGYAIVKPMLSGLAAYLERKGFASLDELRGVALQKLVTHDALHRNHPVSAVIDKDSCVGCLKCEMICRESGNQAISQREGIAVVDSSKCVGCSLCSFICKENAISMRETV